MEELKIAIDELNLRKSDLQGEMGRPFNYGRSPSDLEYFVITNCGIELAKVEGQIAALSDVLESIKSNAAIAAARGTV